MIDGEGDDVGEAVDARPALSGDVGGRGLLESPVLKLDLHVGRRDRHRGYEGMTALSGYNPMPADSGQGLGNGSAAENTSLCEANRAITPEPCRVIVWASAAAFACV